MIVVLQGRNMAALVHHAKGEARCTSNLHQFFDFRTKRGELLRKVCHFVYEFDCVSEGLKRESQRMADLEKKYKCSCGAHCTNVDIRR